MPGQRCFGFRALLPDGFYRVCPEYSSVGCRHGQPWMFASDRDSYFIASIISIETFPLKSKRYVYIFVFESTVFEPCSSEVPNPLVRASQAMWEVTHIIPFDKCPAVPSAARHIQTKVTRVTRLRSSTRSVWSSGSRRWYLLDWSGGDPESSAEEQYPRPVSAADLVISQLKYPLCCELCGHCATPNRPQRPLL